MNFFFNFSNNFFPDWKSFIGSKAKWGKKLNSLSAKQEKDQRPFSLGTSTKRKQSKAKGVKKHSRDTQTLPSSQPSIARSPRPSRKLTSHNIYDPHPLHRLRWARLWILHFVWRLQANRCNSPTHNSPLIKSINDLLWISNNTKVG